jgi:hypothetical protein
MLEYFSSLPEECEYLFFRMHQGTLKPLRYKGKGGKLKPDIKKAWNKALDESNISGYN